MKKNKSIWIIIIILLLAGGIGAYLYFTNNSSKNEKQENQYEANKTSATKEEDKTKNNQNEANKNTTEIKVPITQPQYKEEVISAFSTKIYNKDSARQNNINITCNTLNNTTVKNGETFSFCNTVRASHNCKRISKS